MFQTERSSGEGVLLVSDSANQHHGESWDYGVQDGEGWEGSGSSLRLQVIEYVQGTVHNFSLDVPTLVISHLQELKTYFQVTPIYTEACFIHKALSDQE